MNLRVSNLSRQITGKMAERRYTGTFGSGCLSLDQPGAGVEKEAIRSIIELQPKSTGFMYRAIRIIGATSKH